MASKLLTLQVSDIVIWFRNKELTINETFQRRSIWTPAAKTFLIDTLLRELPIPKIYIRTQIDPVTQSSLREVVDGQQRIRAITEFAENKLRLTKRSDEYGGKKYLDLDDDAKQRFLGYTLGVEQLLNASDDDVLEVFRRLNSYTVTLNGAERRHAEFQTEFKWAVRRAAEDWKDFIEKNRILSIKQRFRMLDDELFAQLFGVFINGIQDGGAGRLNALYKQLSDETFDDEMRKAVRQKLDSVLEYLRTNFGGYLSGELGTPYHLLMIVAGYAHHRYGIPDGQIEDMPRDARSQSLM